MSCPSQGGRVTLPVMWCFVSAALFGASTPASKVLLNDVSPLMLAGLLYLGAAIATLPAGLALLRRFRSPAVEYSKPQVVSQRNVWRLLGAVVFGGVLGPIALLIGLQTAPSASVSLWLNLETTATALLAWAIFRENLSGRDWIANSLVVIAGILLATPAGFAVGPAALLVAFACVCWGIDNNLTAIIDDYTPAQTTFVKGLIAGGVNLALGLATGSSLPSMPVVAAACGVGALAYGASIVLYIRGAQQLGATRSQMIFATAPFLGVAVAWIGLGEPIEGVQALAALLMVGALALLMTGRHDHAHAHPATSHTHAHRHDDGHHEHHHDGLAPSTWHTHSHKHTAIEHNHPHVPDIHHRHEH